MGGRRRLILAVAAVAACGATAAVVLRPGGGREEPRRDVTKAAGLGTHGAELATLLAKGKEAEFHARYRAVSDDPVAAGQELSMELWRKAPMERFDVTVSVGGRKAHSSVFRLPERAVACTSEEGGPWTCQPVAATEPAGPEALIAQITEEMKGGTVVARDDRVDGVPARCFTLPLESYAGEVCMTADGIPARVRAGPSRIELVRLGTDVAAGVFSPPASAG